jgi:3-hydroxyacyl-[acyl-carrier-protein] dehydratase
MLEALVQTAAWLVRVTDEFRHSVVVLREAKGVKYGSFVEPGRQLVLRVEATGGLAGIPGVLGFRGSGEVNGTQTVTARFQVECSRLADRDPALAPLDEQLAAHYRGLYQTLRPASGAAPAKG